MEAEKNFTETHEVGEITTALQTQIVTTPACRYEV